MSHSPSPLAAPAGTGRLCVILGDQLDRDAAVLRSLDPRTDRLWMAEVAGESTRVPSHRARTVVFLAAMRHFATDLVARGFTVDYRHLGEDSCTDLGSALAATLASRRPSAIVATWPGDATVKASLEAVAATAGIPLHWHRDDHFLSTPEEFATFAAERRTLRLEYWYRQLRRRTGLLMEGTSPAGGEWNYDQANRSSFGNRGPGLVPPPCRIAPDAVTRQTMADVNRHLPDLPGELDAFDWPVTPADAARVLDDFVRERLPLFGHFQDAMWSGEATLYHSRLSAALNLKLIHPRTVLEAAVAAYHAGRAPLAAVEGFVRQILGWREYVRGLYWLEMPAYAEQNALDAQAPLPAFYWHGKTPYACLADVVGRTLSLGYTHHIERLMVTGLFALLLGVRPREIHHWYLGLYVDAVEWVELPNVIGMSQYADGGRMASKPYIASGRYIERMSNHCSRCRFRPGEATGPQACPFTTLYWDFLDRHRARFERHPRLGQQVRHLDARPAPARDAIRAAAATLRRELLPESVPS